MRHPRLIPVLLLIIITSLATPLQAQIVLKGKITTEKNEPVAFAPVILQQLPDTTRYTEGVITDMAGNYRFGKHRAGRYLLSVRTIGYKTLYDTVLLRKPSIGTAEVVRDYVLSEDVAEIDAVVVTANNTASYFDRTVYTITNEDRKAAVTSLDLTNKIPQIRIDRQNNQITASDGDVTVLINGIASSGQELTTLRPEDVRKIEYYDLPPIKFGLSNGNKVINIITKIREDGIYGSVELNQHLTSPWLNDQVFLQYNRGRHQLAFRVHMGYGSWDNQYASDEMEYTLDGVDFRQIEEQQIGYKFLSPEGYIKYTNQLPGKYVFQALFYPSYRKNSQQTDSRLAFIQDGIGSDRYGMKESESHSFNPTLDLYFWRQFRNRHELMVTLQGNYINSTSDTYKNQYALSDNTSVFEDFLNTDADNYSLDGQALYTKTFDKLTISVGDHVYYNVTKFRIDNTSGYSRETNSILKNYFAGEITGKIGQRFTYRFTLGVSGSRIKTPENEIWQWVFSPRADIGYRISPSFMLKAGFTQANMPPSTGQLSGATSFHNQNIIVHGNPELVSSRANQTIFSVVYHNKWLNINLSYNYLYMKNPINYYYRYEQPYIAYTPVNDNWYDMHTAAYSLRISPFKNDLLALKLDGAFSYMKVDSKLLGRVTLFRVPLFYELTFNYKNFFAYYQGAIPCKMLSVPTIYKTQLSSSIGVGYKYKDWAFQVSCDNFLTNPKNHYHTVENSIVRTQGIAYNKYTWNRVVLKINFRFGKGKQYQEPVRKTVEEGL